MEDSDVLSPPEKKTADLRKVTPQVFPRPTVKYATAAWGRFVLLSTLFHDEKRGKDLCTLWRFDPSDASWKVIHEENLDMPALSVEVTDPVRFTGFRIAPDARSEDAVVDVWWDLRGGPRWYRLVNEDEVVRVRALPDSERVDFVSWHRSTNGLIAMVEDLERRRQLMRTETEGSDSWQAMPSPGNADQISGFAVFDGIPFVATDDAARGFGLWKLPTGADAAKAESWQPVLEFGAFRYMKNANVLELASCPDGLYLAAGLRRALPADRSITALTPQDFEVIRLYSDDEGWDLIVGQPRFTSDGLKVPLSARGAGFTERDPLQVGCLVNSVGGLHLGVVDNQMAQLWKLNSSDQWREVCHGAFLEYQRARLTAAIPTPHGILLITECLDFGGNDRLELWIVPMEAR